MPLSVQIGGSTPIVIHKNNGLRTKAAAAASGEDDAPQFEWVVEKNDRQRIIWIIIPVNNGYIVIKVTVRKNDKVMMFEAKTVKSNKSRLATSTILSKFRSNKDCATLHNSFAEKLECDIGDETQKYATVIKPTSTPAIEQPDEAALALDIAKMRLDVK